MEEGRKWKEHIQRSLQAIRTVILLISKTILVDVNKTDFRLLFKSSIWSP